MIPRYTLPVIGQIWEDKVKYDTWLAIEVAACEAMNKLGLVPDDDIKIIKEKASYDIDRVAEIEEETKHDVIAFLTAVAEKVGPSSRYIHMGMTSSDILDTTLSVQMVKSCDLILEKLDELIVAIKKKAIKYKKTPQMGRSHGIHAEPVTFGLKMALMYEEFVRNKKRLESAREDVCVGQVSGAVGTKAHIDPSVEEYVCEKLGLKPANISTQIIQRDRHAMFLSVFAVVASSLDKYALEIRNLQKTEVLEVEEFFAKGQKGSSAMPHKRNPITCERVCGLARLIRGNALAGLENVALWHERDITHSSVERIIIPDSCIILYYMLTLMTNVIENLIVYPEHMMKNINITRGLIYSQKVMLELINKGKTREDAYKLVQKAAMNCWKDKTEFKDEVMKDNEIVSLLGKEKIESVFSLESHMKQVDFIFKKVGLE